MEYRNIGTEQNIQQKKDRFELLAPAGSWDIFRAVIAAGADAVYVGGDKFGARAYANNFSTEELLDAIDYAHLHGRKVYLTVNTLLKNTELLDELYDYLLPFYERGLDAVLVQDFGALDFIHRAFPQLPIHTSTQMTVTGVEGARLLAELGAERVVLSREVSLAEMKRIHEETGVELEAFVHGALCYCYSGQCLLSSMLGGRSGNRGRCAQPCRLQYAVLDEQHREYLSDSYILSLKDMCGIEDLNRLADAGVYSLKIEGRMKQIPYAAGVVSYYRKYIDSHAPVSRKDMQDILALGNRCGFTNGYYDKSCGKDMVTFTKPSYEKQDEDLQNRILLQYAENPLKLKADGTLTLKTGRPASYEVRCQDVCVHVTGMEVMPAAKKPLVEQEVVERMAKSGDTPFVMQKIDAAIDDNVFLPNGALNQLRREALGQLKEQLLAKHIRDISDANPPKKRERPGCDRNVLPDEEPARVICLTEKRALLPILVAQKYVTTIYLDTEQELSMAEENGIPQLTEAVLLCRAAGKEVYFVMPRIFRQRTSKRYELLAEQLSKLCLDGIVVRSYEELYFVRKHMPEYQIVLDHSMYTYNDYATYAFAELGVVRNTVPVELNRKEIAHRDNRASEMVIYGRYPLMTSAQCVHRNSKACDKQPSLCYLRDRYKVEFPVKNYCLDCYNVVYNSLPVMLFAKQKELKQMGIHHMRMDFTIESEKQARQVLELYQGFLDGTCRTYPKEWQENYTNGHYNRGVE